MRPTKQNRPARSSPVPCSPSSTPRTEEHLAWRKIINCGKGPIGTEVCEAEWARRLERELNEAHARLRFILDECDWELGGGGDARIGPVIRAILPENAAMDLPGDPNGPKTNSDVAAG